MNYKEAQAKTREALKPKVVDSPESRPQHYVMVGRTPTLVNRKQSRQRNYADPDNTKHREIPQRKLEFHPAPLKGQPQHSHRAKPSPAKWERPDALEYDGNLSNRQKMQLRKAQREVRREKAKDNGRD